MERIVGVYNLNGQPAKKELLENMLGAFKYGSWHDRDYYIRKDLGLAYGRLSADEFESTKETSHKMAEENLLILDGRIYNLQELKNQMEIKGYRFKTKASTEILLSLYKEEGADFIKRLRGEFAFVLYDGKRKSLLLARDRIGKKTLYYYADSEKLIFASEIKAILQDKSVKREIDFKSLDLYLTLGYVPSPRTMFKGIFKLQPAHFIICENKQLETKRYWELSYAYKPVFTLEQWQSKIWELLKESIALRLPDIDSVGVFLSGGVDSSAIVLLLTQVLKIPAKTFSIGFQDRDYSELKYAKLIAERFGTEHHEFVVKPEFKKILPQLIWHYEQPFADSSNIPTYYAAELASRNSRIVLSGDGGDELFGGYERYLGINASLFFDRFPALLPRGVISLMKEKGIFRRDRKLRLSKIERFLDAIFEYRNPLERYLHLVSYYYNSQKQQLYSQTQKGNFNIPLDYFKDIFSQADGKDFIDKIMYLEIMTGLHNDSLVKVGTAAMANSIEVRYPFLDHKLVEFAATIPSNLKLKKFVTKYIFKKTLSQYIPKEVLYRKKMGFAVPVGRWVRKEMKEYIGDYLLGPRFLNRGLFKKETIEKMFKDHLENKHDYTPQLWALLNFELWTEMFIDSGEVNS